MDESGRNEATGGSGRFKRRIPPVSDVVNALIGERGTSERGAIFEAAQKVCGDELRLVRTGFEPATVAELVERARRLLTPGFRFSNTPPIPLEDLDAEPFGRLGPPAAASPPDEPLAPFPAEPPPAPRPIRFAEGPAPTSPERPRDEPAILRAPTEPRGRPRWPGIVAAAAAVGIAAAAAIVWRARGGIPAVAPPAPRAAPAAATGPALRPPISESVAVTTQAPSPAPVSGGAPAAARPAPPPTPVSGDFPPASRGRAGRMVSSDWAGKAPLYMIHFSSYRRIENARTDAKRLSQELAMPAHVLSISLGSQGAWYRVMMGEFATEEAAVERRRQLEATGTPGMGLVYRVTAPSSP